VVIFVGLSLMQKWSMLLKAKHQGTVSKVADKIKTWMLNFNSDIVEQ